VGCERQCAPVEVLQQVSVEPAIKGGQRSGANREGGKGGRGPPGCKDEGGGLLQRGQGILRGRADVRANSVAC
jgi:hypothetical protein